MANKILQIGLTPSQYDWLIKENERTGNAYAASIRSLIQEKIESEKKGHKE